ncbi:MAG: pyridoxamine 5'-phosphate oxidase family protein [Actinomycetota bacterium]|nr:pyridoxamine 5'-phosphate oxidase family protein [Actinomycetota bacterium]
MLFVGSAWLAREAHVNLSPKGPIGTLRILGPREIAYLDVVGSGAETIARLRENGRIVIVLCAFDGLPRILRLHGRGAVAMPGEQRYDELLERCAFDEPAAPEARRAIISVEVTRIADSCGYGVPLMSYEGERSHYDAGTAKKLRTGGAGALADYAADHNARSIDGLAGVRG